MNRQVSLRRLENLLRVAKQFKTEPLSIDMDYYARGVASRYSKPKDVIDKPECGTTCCLLGRAGLDPWFRRYGLKTNLISGYVNIKRLPWDGMISVGKYFGLSDGETWNIFYTVNELTPSGSIDKSRTLSKLIRNIRLAIKSKKEGRGQF